MLEDFLQEIRERRPPDEHAMGSGHDGVDMLDFQVVKLALKRGVRRSSYKIVIADDDLEKVQILIDLIRVLQRVFELIADSRTQRARAEGTYPRKVAKVYNTGLNRLKRSHREPSNRSFTRIIANVIAALDKRNDIVEKLL